ncbi:MAG: ABC transporter permease [Kiritimatiellae bacterium]|nr:ABC transporter permease [Kiritimatiellia bacterium]
MGVSLFLALKYIKPKRSVASVITCVSVIGVMLGVAVVVIVRSVMTGFGDTWREKILAFRPHITIQSQTPGPLTGEDRLADSLRKVPGVTAVNPEVMTRVMLSCNDRVLAPVMIGIGGDDFTKAYDVGEPVAGSFSLENGGLVIGSALAKSLGLGVGSEATVCAPPLPDEVYLPRKIAVTGIFTSGHHDYDSDFIIADLDTVRDLTGMEEGVNAICIKTDCPMDESAFNSTVDGVVRVLKSTRRGYHMLDWKQADRQIFDALAVETNMTAVLLLLISLVALFCVMNTLLVLSVQKTPEIGLLKALGFGKLKIMGVFLIHGLIQCAVGIALGLLASWAVLSNLQRIVSWLAKCGMEVFPAEIYKLEEIPHRVIASDVVFTVAIITVFGLLASLVPALIAASKDPVKALNE